MAKFRFRDRKRNIPTIHFLLRLGVVGCLCFNSATAFMSNNPSSKPMVSSTSRVSSHDEEQSLRAKSQVPTSKTVEPFWKSAISASAQKNAFKSLLTFGFALSLALPSFASDSSSLLVGQKYWTIMNEGEPEAKVTANVALMDYAVGTINTMYYDHSGGASFQPRDFFKAWRQWLETSRESLESREGAEAGLKYLTQQLNDPYSRYLSREELEREKAGSTEGRSGFLHLGVMVEAPSAQTFFRSSLGSPVLAEIPLALMQSPSSLLSASKVQSLPVAMAVVPNSPAERIGLTVGDRIVAVQQESFFGKNAEDVLKFWSNVDPCDPIDITIAKPVYAITSRDDRDVIVAYRPQRLRLSLPVSETRDEVVKSRTVHFELLQGHQSSLFSETPEKVGYVRLTGFSKSATTAFVEAVDELEKEGADAYLIDLRNNYGGVIQESMLAASSLIRDPHAVLCYTLNAGGGFAPHDVEEYVLHERYPGYLMSDEPRTATVNQVKRESPEFFNGHGEWSPPSSYASLREQTVKRGIHRASTVAAAAKDQGKLRQISKKKALVLLVNEGTASSAEVFTSALRDNGRTVAVIGTKTFGKGLIQHTFPLPDGGALRLTVAEYLTPSLRHVTHVGAAQFDQSSGRWIGGGIKPDILCESNGIPSNVGADLCVGVGLDALSEADSRSSLLKQIGTRRDSRPPLHNALGGPFKD